MILEKGIREFVDAARILKERGVLATFQIAGTPDLGNPTAISSDELDDWRREGAVDLLGHVDNIEDIISQAAIVTLPSYREGTPRILLEAAAMGKPIVTTDVPGCREVVDHEENGFLVPAKDPLALANAIEILLNDPQLQARMGKKGLEKIRRDFDDQDVALRTIEVYNLRRESAQVS
ncbi:N,N'-diacetylbacillosaminyl-diphospho-undecaprenol alpha-1,3-N-acetylgalactosaminyltransferase [compost metagenome]